MSAYYLAPATASVKKVSHVSGEPVRLAAEATKSVHPMLLALTTSVKTLVKTTQCVDRTPFVRLVTMRPLALARQASKATQFPNKGVCECPNIVPPRETVPKTTCALPTSVTIPVPTQRLAPLVSGVRTTFAQKFATPTTTACPAKFVNRVSASQDVKRTLIARLTISSVSMESVNAASVLLELQPVALTLMSALTTTDLATRQLCVRTPQALSVVFAQRAKWEMPTLNLAASRPVNATNMRTVPATWPARTESVQTYATWRIVE
jgi:hypothetical protein